MSVWYFAYGAHMQSATLRGRRGVAYSRAVAARVPGWRLVFDKPPLLAVGHGFATIVPDPAAEVLGVLFELAVEALAHVELSEGVRIGNYDAVEVEAFPLAPAAPVRARSLSSARRDPALRPSRRYMALLIEGAIEHGLPDAYVEALRAVPAVEESAEAAALRPLIDAMMKRSP
ncbi:gamma-glutamylcyclotransferase [bacterium]|nr:gamma-glutamylcyclotransferase [bacterium]